MKYIFLLLLISCKKYPVEIYKSTCLKASIEFESTEGLSHVEVYVRSGGRLLFTDIWIKEPFEKEYDLKGYSYDTLFVDYKIFSWVDGSFYTKTDTLL